MKTLIKKEDGIILGASLILSGEVVAFPTETVYGLGADAFNPEAVKKIFLAKGRPQDNPLIVHICDVSELTKVAAEIPDEAYMLFSVFSPGPLTLILKKNPKIPAEVSAGLDTVGVRIPDHNIARELIRLSSPIAAPSANISTRVSATSAQYVYDDFNGKIPLILDGGPTRVGIESTVLNLVGTPAVLRPGAVTAEMLQKYVALDRSAADNKEAPRSPGTKYKHYAPIVDTVLASDGLHAKKEYFERENRGEYPVIIGTEPSLSGLKFLRNMSLGATKEEVENRIYGYLRYAEKAFKSIIIVYDEELMDEAVMNRLDKSTGGKRV